MKILFADKFPDAFLRQIEGCGYVCTVAPDLTAQELPGAVGDHQIVVVRSTKVTSDSIAAGSALKLIIRAGAGTNNIDTQAASKAGVYVCNVPGKNAIAVAELTLGLLLAIDRHIPDNVADSRAGKWDKKRYSEAKGLYGQSIGVIGLGAIGLAVIERELAFGLKVHIIRRPGRTAEVEARLAKLGVCYADDVHALADCCDILSFHVPASGDTAGMVDSALLSRLRDGAVIINTSRGDVIDEAALLKVLDEKGIRVGLDVYQDEPATGQADFDCALARHPNVYGTHHIGASTEQEQDAVAEGVVAILAAYGEGKILNCVNMAD